MVEEISDYRGEHGNVVKVGAQAEVVRQLARAVYPYTMGHMRQANSAKL